MQFVVRRGSTTIAFAQLDFWHDHRSPNHRRPLQLAKPADRRGGSGGVFCLGRTDIPCLEPARACRVLGNVGLGLAWLAGNVGIHSILRLRAERRAGVARIALATRGRRMALLIWALSGTVIVVLLPFHALTAATLARQNAEAAAMGRATLPSHAPRLGFAVGGMAGMLTTFFWWRGD